MHVDTLSRVRNYYSRFREWNRLSSPAGSLEFLRVMRIVRAAVSPPADVLDLGGGPGRYTIALAEAGYRPTLADISPELVREAEKRIRRARCGAQVTATRVVDGVRLSGFDDRGFDAVLALGPFYHLVEESHREELAREVVRVARPGAWLAVAFLPRLAGLRGLIVRAAGLGNQVPPGTLRATLDTGVFHNGEQRGFQEGWFAEPAEIQDLFERAGARTLSLVSLKGVAAGQERALQRLERRAPDRYQEALEVIEDTAQRPELVATADHALWIGRVGTVPEEAPR